MQRASSMRVVMMIKVTKIKQTHKLRKNQLKLLRVLDVQRQNGFLGRNASEGKKRCEIHIMPFFIKMENTVAKTRHKCLKHAKQKQEEALRKQKADEPAEPTNTAKSQHRRWWQLFWLVWIDNTALVEDEKMIHFILKNEKNLYLTHSFPMHPFSKHGKHQKTVRFSDVFRG